MTHYMTRSRVVEILAALKFCHLQLIILRFSSVLKITCFEMVLLILFCGFDAVQNVNFSKFYLLSSSFSSRFRFCFLILIQEKRDLTDKTFESSAKIDRSHNQASGSAKERLRSVTNEVKNDCANDDSSDDESCDTCSTGSNSTDDNTSGLNEDLFLSESDELPIDIDASEIIHSISSPPVQWTLPIPRKPNDLRAPSKVKKLATSKTVTKRKRVENSKKNGTVEKRNMYIPITQAQLDRYDINFLKGDVGNVRKIVSGMCHSLRFWLTAKFCKSLERSAGGRKKGALSKAEVCKRLGIDINRFKTMERKIKGKTFLDYDRLSPLEFSYLRRRSHARYIKKYAQNLSCKTVQYVISVLPSDSDTD